MQLVSICGIILAMETQTPDFTVENHGSIVLLQPHTPAANDFVDEYLPADAMRWSGAIVVEPRYIADIVEGAMAEGLTVA